jgi:hypothetical protein
LFFTLLDDDERVIAETAAAFAAKRLAPHALEWDAAKHFRSRSCAMREAAELGMAVIYCRGADLRRTRRRRSRGRRVPVDPQHVRLDGRRLRHP